METDNSCDPEKSRANGDLAQEAEEIEVDPDCREFIQDLVYRIFNKSATIVQEDNAKFGVYSRTPEGRLLFAQLVDSQRVNTKRVSEQTFYRLVQFFALCLFECNEADDFRPAKCLMNMSFTFYHYSEEEGDSPGDGSETHVEDDPPACISNEESVRPGTPNPPKVKSFLYTHLKEQPIWKSQRFWNASFFESVHHERQQQCPEGKRGHWRHMSSEEQELAEILEENITFGQLATFLHNMMALGLDEDRCSRFLTKMGTIGNITPEQDEMLKANITSHFQTGKEKEKEKETGRRRSSSSHGTPIKQKLSSLMKLPSLH